MLLARAAVLALCVLTACDRAEDVSAGERRAIADSLQHLVTSAYDFAKPGAPARLLSLYPDSGRVISAAGGHITSSRAALEAGINTFWQHVGQNMQGPTFVLGSAYVDVVTRNAAVMSFTYSIPHRTPAGNTHVVSGAWTSFWRRQNGRWMIVQEHLSDTPESSMPSTMMPNGGMPAGGLSAPPVTGGAMEMAAPTRPKPIVPAPGKPPAKP
jgi:ketosteroid isomerase-like protein